MRAPPLTRGHLVLIPIIISRLVAVALASMAGARAHLPLFAPVEDLNFDGPVSGLDKPSEAYAAHPSPAPSWVAEEQDEAPERAAAEDAEEAWEAVDRVLLSYEYSVTYSCPAGQYKQTTINWWGTDCLLCPSGRYSTTTGITSASQCTLCPAGQYRTQGYFYTNAGTSCFTCPPVPPCFYCALPSLVRVSRPRARLVCIFRPWLTCLAFGLPRETSAQPERATTTGVLLLAPTLLAETPIA